MESVSEIKRRFPAAVYVVRRNRRPSDKSIAWRHAGKEYLWIIDPADINPAKDYDALLFKNKGYALRYVYGN